jgi:hypothetical protein
MILLGLGAAVVAAGGALGMIQLRSSRRLLHEYSALVDAFTVDDIHRLERECVRAFGADLGVRLDLGDLYAIASKLDEVLRSQKAVLQLSTDDRPLRTVELAGAFLGELVRRHGRGEWVVGGRSPGVRVRRMDGDRDLLPFVDALNQFKAGRPGDLSSLILFVSGRSDAPLRAGHWAAKRRPIE